MKFLKFVALLGVLSFPTQAQISVNITIGSPPPWGPIGYTEVRYYYLPDVEAYYDVQSSMFIYFGSGVWLHRRQLPHRYRYYDLYGGYKVVLTDYHGDQPYTHFNQHKMKYAKGYRGVAQKTIGAKPEKGNSQKNSSSNGKSNNKNKEGAGQKSQDQGKSGHGSGGEKGGHGNGGGKKK